MHFNNKFILLLPLNLVAICFFFSFLFFIPVINSDDDVFLMYQLAGGFGELPDNLLHYDHILHPWLGAILAALFRWQPNFNWYTGFFILCQYISWVMIARVLLHLFNRRSGLAVFFLLFLLAGVNGLQSLNLTSTTWVFSISIVISWIYFPRFVIIYFFLLLIAGSIRLQIPLIVTGLFISVQWNLKKISWWKSLFPLLAICISFFLLNLVQKKYYSKNIHEWDKSESLRQDLFYAFNRPKDMDKPDSLIFQNATEKAFYERLFLFDEHFPGRKRLAEISRASVRRRDLSQKDDLGALYWTWVAWRLYLLYIMIAIILALHQRVLFKWVKKIWFPLSGSIAFYFFLFLFFKFTDAFFMGLILIMAVQMVLFWPVSFQKKSLIPAFLFLLPIAWSLNRDIHIDRQNREYNRILKCGLRELAASKQYLFIATGDAIPIKYFRAIDLPAKNSLENFIYKERLLTRSYFNSLRKYGLSGNFKKGITAPVLRFAGPYFPELLNWAGADSLVFSATDSSFHCLEIRKLLVK